ncbi:MAG: hypothetical protein R6V45_04095 [Oceanipulchritudo sp.]
MKHLLMPGGLVPLSCLLAVLLLAGSQLPAADTDPLADLLVRKGVISSEEASSLKGESQPALAELLVRKGIITRTEAENLDRPNGPDEAGPLHTKPAASPDPGKAMTGNLPLKRDPVVTSSINLSLYGYVKLDAIYDSQRTNNGNQARFVLPESGQGDDDVFSLTARQTRLGLRVSAPVRDDWEANGRIEIDFYGSGGENAAEPRTRLAYLSLNNGNWEFLAGQDYDTWNMVLPKTNNFATGGFHGTLWSRRAQARATRTWSLGERSALAGSIGMARNVGLEDIDNAGDGLDGGEDSGLPIFQWNLLYSTGLEAGEARFSVGGQYGEEEVERSLTDRDADFITSMLMLSFDVPLTPALGLSGAAWAGENLGGFQGGIGQRINLLRNTEIAATGGWLQARYKTGQDLLFNLAVGMDNPEDSDLNQGGRSRNTTLSANVFWNFLPSTTWILEYQYLKTRYRQSANASNNRWQSALLMKF